MIRSIHSKFILVLLCLTLVPLAISAYSLLQLYKKKLIIHEVEKQKVQLHLKIESMVEVTRKMENLVLGVRDFPPIENIFRLREKTTELDAQAQLEVWMDRLMRLFRSVASVDNNIYQVSLLDKKGQEILKVMRRNNQLINAKNLQNKNKSSYHKIFQNSEYDQVFATSIELNVENGVIEEPYVPVVRYGTKLIDKVTGAELGYILINYNVENILKELSFSMHGEVLLIDSNGQYLYNSDDPAKTFGKQLGHKHNFILENADYFQSITERDSHNSFYDEKKKQFVSWEKIYYSSHQPDLFWMVFSVYSDEEVFKEYDEIKQIVTLWSFFLFTLVLIVAYGMSRYFVDPLIRLSRVHHAFSQGQVDFKNFEFAIERKDELGYLATSFLEMVAAIQKSNEEKLEKNKKLQELIDASQKQNEFLEKSQKATTNLLDDLRKEKEIVEEYSKKAEAANLAKSDFLANMSHEIRTPLNAIIGFSDLMSKTALDAVQAEYLKTIHDSGDLLLGIINDILDFSKIEAGHIQLEKIEFDLDKLMKGVLNIIISRLKDQEVQLNYFRDPSVSEYFKGDPTRLRQIMINLLSNAVKFTEVGEINIKVFQEKTAGNDRLLFEVSDTGIGIPDEKKKTIFDSFSQADTSTTRKYGGTGLGLSITKRLIELMGGWIKVESNKPKGSKFVFEISLEQIDKKSDVKVASIEAIKNKKVIIVDDNKTARYITSNYLSEFGILVAEEFCSVEEALQYLNKARDFPDLILSDIMMPRADGYALAKQLGEEKKYDAIKLIAITSEVVPGTAKKAKDAGFDGYVTKPVFKNDLRHVIQVVFGIEESSEDSEIVTRHTYDEKSLSNIHVLVAEDNAVNQKLIQALLSKLGCQCTIVEDGEKAVAKMKDENFDICLMDLQMPNMGGVEATKIIRKELKVKTPIIALTAAVLKEDRESALDAGMNEFLTKPIVPHLLKDTLFKFTH